MSIIDKIISINGVLKEIFEYLQTDDTVKSDFSEYLATIGAKNITSAQLEKVFLPYIFERYIDKEVRILYSPTYDEVLLCKENKNEKN